MTTTTPAVQVEGLTRRFRVRSGVLGRREVTAVDDLTLTIGAGESVGYIGANGAGKSTFLKLVFGLHKPTAGDIFLDDKKQIFRSSLDAI